MTDTQPEPQQLDITSPDMRQARLDELKRLFPGLFDGEGNLDDAALRALAMPDGATSSERFRFEWAGKQQSKRYAFAPSRATLVADVGRSVDFETTGNLIIEGDNLEVLKLLQKTYFERVKCIYIDPPYNKDADVIYPDDYSETKKAYWQKNGTVKDGVRLTSVTESSGRKHSKWLNMIQERLLLSRQLLCSEGMVFVSIDDDEVNNLRKLLDEIFGPENFIGQIVREAVKGGTAPSSTLRRTHDYVVVYAKSKEYAVFGGEAIEGEELDREDEKGPYRKGRELNKWGAGSRREDSPSMYYPIPGPNGEDVYPVRNDGSDGRWRWGRKKLLDAVSADEVIFEPRGDGTYVVYEKIRSSEARTKTYPTFMTDLGQNAEGTEDVKRLFEGTNPFSYPSP